MVEIVQKGAKVLREVAQPVDVDTITSKEVQEVINDMKEALASQKDGVAIAAPQIGVPLRIFVVSHRAFEIEGEPRGKAHDMVFINPEIVKRSKKKAWMDEGCLSVRWFYGIVRRSKNVTVTAYDEKGERFTRGAGGLLAQIFQHEIDHLDGILFVDKARDIEEIIPEDNEK